MQITNLQRSMSQNQINKKKKFYVSISFKGKKIPTEILIIVSKCYAFSLQFLLWLFVLILYGLVYKS